MSLSKKETIRVEVYPQEDNPLAMLRSLIGASLNLPDEVKVTLNALKLLSNPGDATLRVPALSTIQ